jgi:hypothetical protein
MVVVNTVHGSVISYLASCVMGLAFQSLFSIKAEPFWQTLISEKQLDSPEMGFFLGRYDDDPSNPDDIGKNVQSWWSEW